MSHQNIWAPTIYSETKESFIFDLLIHGEIADREGGTGDRGGGTVRQGG